MPEYPCPEPIAVDIRVDAGSVEVHAEPRDTATVDVTPDDDSDAAREAAEATRVELSGGTLSITAPDAGKWLWRRSPRLRVHVRVPPGSTGWFRVASADLTGTGQWADIKVNTASGDASIEQVTGDLTVNTASGGMRIGSIGGRLTVKSASGDVTARRVGGPVAITSASGEVQLTDAADDVSVKSVSGKTSIQAVRRGTLRANSVSGDVSVGVVSGTGAWLDLNTLSGKARSDLDMDGGRPPATEPALTVQVRTVSGDIDIHRTTLPA